MYARSLQDNAHQLLVAICRVCVQKVIYQRHGLSSELLNLMMSFGKISKFLNGQNYLERKYPMNSLS